MQPQSPQEPQAPTPVVPQPTPAPTTPQPQDTPLTQPETYTTPAPSKKRFPKWLKIVGILALVFGAFLIVATIIAFTATQAPQKVSDQFINDVQAGDADAAYTLTNDAFQAATSLEQLDEHFAQISPLLQGEEKVSGRAIASSTGVPQTAVLVYNFETSDGTKYMKVELQKSGDDWKVLNFRSSETPLDTDVE